MTIGSNVFNLAALLGLGAVVAGRIGLHRKVVVLGGTVALEIATVCFLAVAGVISAGTGLALVLLVLVPYIVLLGARRRAIDRLGLPRAWAGWLKEAVVEEEIELEAAIRPRRGRSIDAVVALGALTVVVVASVAMEQGASALGVRYGIAEIVVGGLVLAAVTSLPNAVAAVYLARKGRGAAALSTALNSNAINVTVGLLIPATVIGLSKPSGSGLLVAGWYLGLTAVTLLLAYVFGGLHRILRLDDHRAVRALRRRRLGDGLISHGCEHGGDSRDGVERAARRDHTKYWLAMDIDDVPLQSGPYRVRSLQRNHPGRSQTLAPPVPATSTSRSSSILRSRSMPTWLAQAARSSWKIFAERTSISSPRGVRTSTVALASSVSAWRAT